MTMGRGGSTRASRYPGRPDRRGRSRRLRIHHARHPGQPGHGNRAGKPALRDQKPGGDTPNSRRRGQHGRGNRGRAAGGVRGGEDRREFPGVEIINLSRNGAKLKDTLGQLESVADSRFDIVLVQAGGNDILGFTDLGELKDTTRQVLQSARGKGKAVVFMTTGNVGLAPAFFPPISWILTARTREARAVFLDVSRESGVQYVDLFREKGNEIFLGDPDRYYTPDYLHPSSEGYRVWYEELKKQTDIVERLGKGPGRAGPTVRKGHPPLAEREMSGESG